MHTLIILIYSVKLCVNVYFDVLFLCFEKQINVELLT